jgi:hypothetical protein
MKADKKDESGMKEDGGSYFIFPEQKATTLCA